MTPITGLTDKYINSGWDLQTAREILLKLLPKNACLIGQNINNDIDWLKLKRGIHFRDSVDLRKIWRKWSKKHNSYTIFSLRHQAKCIVNIPEYAYAGSASYDGKIAMILFKTYIHNMFTNPLLIKQLKTKLSVTTAPKKFSSIKPFYNGVCMGNKLFCKCGATPLYTFKPSNINTKSIKKNIKITPELIQKKLNKLLGPDHPINNNNSIDSNNNSNQNNINNIFKR